MNVSRDIGFIVPIQPILHSPKDFCNVIAQIRTLPEAEIADMQKEIDKLKQEAVAAMERLERTRKWLGIID
jgi:hypothetical protein